MRNENIAIQGSIASFHDQAAKKFFGNDINIIECGSFREVCERLSKNQVDYGIIAIENKVAGTILLNYQLIEHYVLNIIGETYLPVELFLLGNEGVTLNDVQEIISHPMALGQCQDFLSGLEDVKITEYKDTAESAKLIIKNQDKHVAVIAGGSVVEHYGLNKISENICDEKVNFTRFYIMTKGNYNVEHPNKASVNLISQSAIGSLSEILLVFKKYQINLTKIQSVPIPNNTEQYIFHLDLEFTDRNDLELALDAVKILAQQLKVLGIYRSAKLIV
ncbi:MAG: prephenate dehydratase [Bacteroidetes bacterium]|nr:prephenate dehydratase [Bacteroidota bacterium]